MGRVKKNRRKIHPYDVDSSHHGPMFHLDLNYDRQRIEADTFGFVHDNAYYGDYHALYDDDEDDAEDEEEEDDLDGLRKQGLPIDDYLEANDPLPAIPSSGLEYLRLVRYDTIPSSFLLY